MAETVVLVVRRRWLRVLRYFGLARPWHVTTYSELALLQEHDEAKRTTSTDALFEAAALMRASWTTSGLLLREFSRSVPLPTVSMQNVRITLRGCVERVDLWSDWVWSG